MQPFSVEREGAREARPVEQDQLELSSISSGEQSGLENLFPEDISPVQPQPPQSDAEYLFNLNPADEPSDS